METLIYNPNNEELKNDIIPDLSYVVRKQYTPIYLDENKSYTLYSVNNSPQFLNGDILYINDFKSIKNLLTEEEYNLLIQIYSQNNVQHILLIKLENRIHYFPIYYISSNKTYYLSLKIMDSTKSDHQAKLCIMDFVFQSYIQAENKIHLIKLLYQAKQFGIYECLDSENKTYLTIWADDENINIQRIFAYSQILDILYTNYQITQKDYLPNKKYVCCNIENTIVNGHKIPVYNGLITISDPSNEHRYASLTIEKKKEKDEFYSQILTMKLKETQYKYGQALIVDHCYIPIVLTDYDYSSVFLQLLDSYNKCKKYQNKIKNDDNNLYLIMLLQIYPELANKSLYNTMEENVIEKHIIPLCSKILINPHIDHIPASFNLVLGEITSGPNDNIKSWISVFSKQYPGIKVEMSAYEFYNILNNEFPYMEEANLLISQYLALSHKTDSYIHFPNIILNGAPGIGKTKWANRVSELCGMKYFMKNMAGISTSMDITGAERGWSSTRPGFWAYAIRDTEIINPIIVLDEIDKMSQDEHNGNPYSALLPFLEKETSSRLYDVCLQTQFNLSLFSYIMTTNHAYNIPPVFLSRTTIIECKPPTQIEINKIFNNIVLDVKKELGLDSDYVVDNQQLLDIRDKYDKHQSIRIIKKEIKDFIINGIFNPNKQISMIRNDTIINFPGR